MVCALLFGEVARASLDDRQTYVCPRRRIAHTSPLAVLLDDTRLFQHMTLGSLARSRGRRQSLLSQPLATYTPRAGQAS